MKRGFLKKSLALSISFALILNLLLLISSVWANSLPNGIAFKDTKATTNPGARQDFSLPQNEFDFSIASVPNNNTAISYGYDHTGQRVKLDNGSATTLYPNKYFNTRSTGSGQADTTKHIFTPNGTLIATVDGSGVNSSTINYIHTDHLGGTHVVSDQNGMQVELNDYYPFGDLRINEGVFNEQRKFTGHEYDTDTNLTYANARYYNQNIGRWLSQDPAARDNPRQFLADPQQLNGYAYGRNNPLKFLDPTGKANSEFQPYFPFGNSYLLGERIGSYRGVTLYSAGPETGSGSHDFQCVSWSQEFARSEYGVELGGTGNAWAYGSQSHLSSSFKRNNPSDPGQYITYNNGNTVMPQENDIISWSGGDYGHVGVISEVVFDPESGSGYVYSLEQNFSSDQAMFSQPFTRSYNDQGQAVYNVHGRGSYRVQGWARYENQSRINGRSTNFTSIQHTPATAIPLSMTPL